MATTAEAISAEWRVRSMFFLIWLIKTAVTLFWIMDILNMPFMEMFDTTYPFNTLFWILVFSLCGGVSIKVKK